MSHQEGSVKKIPIPNVDVIPPELDTAFFDALVRNGQAVTRITIDDGVINQEVISWEEMQRVSALRDKHDLCPKLMSE
jgi:hypothetical protein